MRAMLLKTPRSELELADVPKPRVSDHQVLIEVNACGVCRTDLHILDGELAEPELPLVMGHQIIGRVVECGREAGSIEVGQRVGVPWLGSTCGECGFCQSSAENLCDNARFTGYQINGGFAEFACADARFCFAIPDSYPDLQAAPLLCAGLIGYRALTMAGNAQRIGFYGFGAAAHILCQICKHQGREVYAFTREGDDASQKFARELGAVWAAGSEESPPQQLDAAIIFAPIGELVPLALKAVRKGGRVVCAGIHMSEIPSFPYSDLWGERTICSVANLTREDGIGFFEIAPKVPVQTEVTAYPLDQANQALSDLRNGRFQGAAVIEIKPAGSSH